MKHLPDERLCALAEMIVRGDDFSKREERDMLHIANCEECYRLLRCMMAMLEVTDSIDLLAKDAGPDSMDSQTTAVIKIAIFDVRAVMEQMQAQNSTWMFSQPLSLAGFRSGSAGMEAIQKLEDDANSQTYIAYDAAKRVLVIQLDCGQEEAPPRALLKYPDGTVHEVPLERREHLFWAEVHDLKVGEYEVILEK